MGARGPLPARSATVTQLHGNSSAKAKAAKRPPTVASRTPPGRPTPPDELTVEARAEWDRVVPELDSMGVLAKIDRGVLVAYCTAWSVAREALTRLEVEGLTSFTRDNTLCRNPVYQIWREATSLHTSLAKDLMATPVARLRSPAPGGDVDEFDPDGILD